MKAEQGEGEWNNADRHLEISVSKAKSEAIAYLLKNAEIGIYEEDLFASQIDHAGIMRDLLSERVSKIKALEISDKIRELEQNKTIRADMKVGNVSLPIQMIAKIINEATGVARITVSNGRNSL